MDIIYLSITAILFIAPGFLLSSLLKTKPIFLTSPLFSSLLLFHSIFWLEVLRFRISFASVSALLLLQSIGIVLLMRKKKISLKLPALCFKDFSKTELMLAGLCLLPLLSLAIKSFNVPFEPGDPDFRWNCIALRMLELGNFSFYPAMVPADFDVYFYIDSMPQMVGFIYFYLYSAAGHYIPYAVTLSVICQYAILLCLCFKLGEVLYGRRAGLLAALTAGSSIMLFRSSVIGQETCLTAISMLGIFYFIMSADKDNMKLNLILAGLAAALGALSREYGPAFTLCGLAALLFRKASYKDIAISLAVVIALAAPWYLRTWIISGNPFYSTPCAGLFPVNPVHAGIMNTYKASLSFMLHPFANTMQALQILLLTAPLQLAGLVTALIFFRKNWLFLLSAGGIFILWIYSVGLTSGGFLYSMRMLSPALALLSIPAGFLLLKISEKLTSKLFIGIMTLLLVLVSLQNLIFPFALWSTAPSNWLRAALEKPFRYPELIFRYTEVIPPESRILGSDAALQASLYNKADRKITMSPVWSPEFAPLFNEKIPYAGKIAYLKEIGVRYYLYQPGTMNNAYLERFSFFRLVKERSRLKIKDSFAAVLELY